MRARGSARCLGAARAASRAQGRRARLVPPQAVDNVTPHLDVRTIRTATKTTYVPGVMPAEKGRSLALHWLVRAAEARKKSSKGPFAECLALELLLAFQKRGPARQKRDDLHKLALQNRANLHLRWW
ncbi:MAG: ribosomal protein S7 domain-containing protein [Monoraphidium minutum]|nr:MAG: ribosomal protein S7 domain-containing protein [Monoraphidium minutum]